MTWKLRPEYRSLAPTVVWKLPIFKLLPAIDGPPEEYQSNQHRRQSGLKVHGPEPWLGDEVAEVCRYQEDEGERGERDLNQAEDDPNLPERQGPFDETHEKSDPEADPCRQE